MKPPKSFLISSLVAAGFFPSSGLADDSTPSSKPSLLNDISSIISPISDHHQFTLAGHRSHQSHGSHQSHRSGSYSPTTNENGNESNGSSISDVLEKRNEMSTPRSSILPRSYGTLKKVKVLPGNSSTFQKILIRVQVALNGLGYDIGSEYGQLQAKTMAALYQYQQDKGFIPSGKISHEVLDSLGIVAQ